MQDYQPNGRAYWNAAAETFDQEPDHGLGDLAVRAAWQSLLAANLPAPPGRLLDLGCGTGSLTRLLVEQGYAVTGVDFAPAMIARARAKMSAAALQASFCVMDAFRPALAAARFDLLICRHVLWTAANAAEVVQSWARLVRPGGRLALVEGFWHTGGGLHAAQALAALPDGWRAELTDLSVFPELWGGAVDDERYLVVARQD